MNKKKNINMLFKKRLTCLQHHRHKIAITEQKKLSNISVIYKYLHNNP